MLHSIRLIIVLLSLFLSQRVYADFLLSFNLINGVFSYDSEVITGKSSVFMSPSFSLYYPISEKNLIGINTEIHFSILEKTTSLYAIGFSHRYYFLGNALPTLSEGEDTKIEVMSKWSSFSLVEINKYTYFLGENTLDNGGDYEQTGSFFNLDIGGGVDYSLSHDYRLSTALKYTFVSFSSSDDRVKLKGLLLLIGFSKAFK